MVRFVGPISEVEVDLESGMMLSVDLRELRATLTRLRGGAWEHRDAMSTSSSAGDGTHRPDDHTTPRSLTAPRAESRRSGNPEEPGNRDRVHRPSAGITFLEGFDRDLRAGLASEIRALWTHHSTALEGNSLTLGDTAFVLQEGLTVGGKSLKDHQEVIGHARAIDLLYDVIGQRRLVEISDLHALHRAIQLDVVMDVFNPVGNWKVEPNGTTALLTSGHQQWHNYARPEHVPDLMAEWVRNLGLVRRSVAETLDAYTDLHLGFTAIHPYADGNGRMARLLANLPVIEGGAPPVLVPLERRREYMALMGDWSLARGVPRPGEVLVPPIDQRRRLREFFAEVARPAIELVAAYRAHQAARA
jgi:fido (protein-threonine AMPylation protein)